MIDERDYRRDPALDSAGNIHPGVVDSRIAMSLLRIEDQNAEIIAQNAAIVDLLTEIRDQGAPKRKAKAVPEESAEVA